MKASSESGEWASLISTVCSPDFSGAVRADIRVELPFGLAPRQACGGVPGRFLCGKKGSTGEQKRPETSEQRPGTPSVTRPKTLRRGGEEGRLPSDLRRGRCRLSSGRIRN